ncbi:RNA polymerase sigma factor, sigma-70 family [Microlunatus sagamiharensis]|uniref:RNA polymerase sigma factor, sigma-70 family n=1 Tax=Microlunatus sagamiharensis TaxID=546874 RepID=A0A1H2N175_9ACTN|nr:sigma-70 family RNA polymerase sigma factor [Microlunatus sagamiharensis]SDU99269.1 RNA polymerase sigma factor, sigma-70 family [Microlunatus sagamiharensis]
MPGLPPFDRVVREHGAVVLRVCRAVLSGDAEADDAWQETFLAAMRAYPGLDPGTNLQAWLVTVAHRKALDVVRARDRRPLVDPRTHEGATTSAAAPEDPARAAEDRVLRDAVAALPERQRWAVALHHLGGLSWAEVAALVGGTEQAARRAGADGVAALRRTGGWR